jgi:hypothetical protein
MPMCCVPFPLYIGGKNDSYNGKKKLACVA